MKTKFTKTVYNPRYIPKKSETFTKAWTEHYRDLREENIMLRSKLEELDTVQIRRADYETYVYFSRVRAVKKVLLTFGKKEWASAQEIKDRAAEMEYLELRKKGDIKDTIYRMKTHDNEGYDFGKMKPETVNHEEWHIRRMF